MSIATQTPEHIKLPPAFYDGMVQRESLPAPTRYGEVIDFPAQDNDYSDERLDDVSEHVGPQYTFENLIAIREEVAELEDRLQSRRQDAAELWENGQIIKEQIADLSLFAGTAMSSGRISPSVARLRARLEAVSSDFALTIQDIQAKETTKKKVQSWQDEVEEKLEQVYDPQLGHLKQATAAYPYRLGSLDRTDGTIADRTPQH